MFLVCCVITCLGFRPRHEDDESEEDEEHSSGGELQIDDLSSNVLHINDLEYDLESPPHEDDDDRSEDEGDIQVSPC